MGTQGQGLTRQLTHGGERTSPAHESHHSSCPLLFILSHSSLLSAHSFLTVDPLLRRGGVSDPPVFRATTIPLPARDEPLACATPHDHVPRYPGVRGTPALSRSNGDCRTTHPTATRFPTQPQHFLVLAPAFVAEPAEPRPVLVATRTPGSPSPQSVGSEARHVERRSSNQPQHDQYRQQKRDQHSGNHHAPVSPTPLRDGACGFGLNRRISSNA